MRAPTPRMPCSSSMLVGRSRASSRSVVSWKMTYGGTPRERAISRRTARRRSNRSRSTSCQDSDSIRDRFATRSFTGRRCRASTSPGSLPGPSAARRRARSAPHRKRIVCLAQEPVRDELLDVAAHLRRPACRSAARTCSARGGGARSPLDVAAAQHVGDVGDAEALADARDARQDLARERRPAPPTVSSSSRQ